ncbi:ribonuclease D [Ningiella sp. W23]|uniref:ribonuclease D n=1 Tax=Ningiella sp. W23 TaxID=3023715 RepID=UPI0037566065
MTSNNITQLAHLKYEYVDTQSALAELCAKLNTADVITLDTEFVRTKTLRPRLGLLQVFDGQHLALIDPVVLDDLSCFVDILSNPKIVKVLHSCSEDIEALLHNLDATPYPLFDTQFANSLLGKGASVGYANMIETMFSVTLDKGESRTDWLARPLSPKQLDYAAKDVSYLMAAYEVLKQELELANLSDCVFSESELLIEKKRSPFPEASAYLLVANNWKLNGKSLYALKLLAQWRLREARKHDIAINFVVKESAMLEIAMKLPETPSQLHQMHALFGKQVRLYGQKILSIVQQARDADEEEHLKPIQRLIGFAAHKKAMSDIKELVLKVESKTGIPAAVLASKKQIAQVLKWCWFDLDETEIQGLKPDLLHGWRRELFLEGLQALFDLDKPSEPTQGKYRALRSL